MEPIRFSSRIRYWNPEKASGLSVADIPSDLIAAFGGLKQQRVRGSMGGAEFTSNVMPAGGGRLALSVSKAMMTAAHASIGDEVDIDVAVIGALEAAVEALLTETEAAHGVFESTELKGVYDQEWATWYASYAVNHGIDKLVGRTVSAEELAELLTSSFAAFKAAAPAPTEPWQAWMARRIAEEFA